MKKAILVSGLMAITLVLSSCLKKQIKPSSDVTTESRNLSGFTALDVSDAIEVEVTFDPNVENVVISANSNIHQYILTDVVNGRLKIRMKNNINIKSGAYILVKVSTPYLEGVDISGASRVEFTNDETVSYMDLDISGASTFQGGFTATDCDINLSGASNVSIWGGAASANIDLSGASRLGDYDFIIDNLNVELSGASTATLTVNGVMNVNASGASTLNYKGTALIDNMESSGASSIIKH
jgi:hypothetical protein